jgi:hypothetical protein
MKSYSDDIVTPDAQSEAIKFAFMAQNAFIASQATSVKRFVGGVIAGSSVFVVCAVALCLIYIK